MSGEAIAKCCPNFWPLGRDHAVPGGVAPGAVGQRHVSAMDALKLRGQRLHRRARPSVASVGLEFDALTVELLERPTEQEQLGLHVGTRPPPRPPEPGPSDLKRPVLGSQRHVAGAADRPSAGAVDDRPGALLARRCRGERLLHPLVEPFGRLERVRKRRQVPPHLAIVPCVEQALLVLGPERLDDDQLAPHPSEKVGPCTHPIKSRTIARGRRRALALSQPP